MGDNAALMRRWFRDVWRPGGETTVDELLASDATGVMEDRQVHVPATQKSVAFRGMSWVEIENGQIVRGWDSWNLGALLQSLGAGPADVRP